ncbi:hypothetical protein K501DRAFT_276191 [Backusella circina FSU 941]|nr:hypothetical protein K501DRAFT_276191 [Backusella circina FSU 941]
MFSEKGILPLPAMVMHRASWMEYQCGLLSSLSKKLSDASLRMAVQDHFQKWGPILNVKVLRDWLCRPYAFVQYEEVTDAQRALKEAQGDVLNERHLRCEPARVNRTLFLINYKHPFTKQEIERSVLPSFGTLEDITCPAYDSGYFALVKFCYRNDAIEAFHALKSGNCCPSQWQVEWASNFDMSNKVAIFYDYQSIFVGNLPNHVTSDALSDLFGKCGDVKYIRIIKKSPKNKVYAFVKFALSFQAYSAIRNYNGILWQDKILHVSLREFKTNQQKSLKQQTLDFDGCVHYSYYYYLQKSQIQQGSYNVINMSLYIDHDVDPFYYQVLHNNDVQYPVYCVLPYYENRF